MRFFSDNFVALSTYRFKEFTWWTNCRLCQFLIRRFYFGLIAFVKIQLLDQLHCKGFVFVGNKRNQHWNRLAYSFTQGLLWYFSDKPNKPFVPFESSNHHYALHTEFELRLNQLKLFFWSDVLCKFFKGVGHGQLCSSYDFFCCNHVGLKHFAKLALNWYVRLVSLLSLFFKWDRLAVANTGFLGHVLIFMPGL